MHWTSFAGKITGQKLQEYPEETPYFPLTQSYEIVQAFETMATISFSPNIRSQVDVETSEIEGETLASAMESLFSRYPNLRTYLLNDDRSVRKHVAFVINGEPIKDRTGLSDPLSPSSDIFVMQALSGG